MSDSFDITASDSVDLEHMRTTYPVFYGGTCASQRDIPCVNESKSVLKAEKKKKRKGEPEEKKESVLIPQMTLLHGDCVSLMKDLPDSSVDMILCDLPYGMTQNKWDIVIPFDVLWEQYNRVITNNGCIALFGNQPFSSMLVVSNLKIFRYSLVCVKNKFSDFLNAKRKPMKVNEDILIFYKKQPTYNPQYTYAEPYVRWNTQEAVDKQTNYGKHKKNVARSDGQRLPLSVLYFNRVERPKHPTQKPVELLKWLIQTYTNEGDTVLDNCMGSGSTGVACLETGRNFIGMEINDEYFQLAEEWIENVRRKH